MKSSIDLTPLEIEPLRSTDLRAQGKTFDLMIESMPEADPDVHARAVHVSIVERKGQGATIDMAVDRIGRTDDVLFKAGADSLAPTIAGPDDEVPTELPPPPPPLPKKHDPWIIVLSSRIGEMRLVSALGAYLIVVLPIFFLSEALGLGAAEAHTAMTARLTWIRCAMLFMAALALNLALPEDERLTAEDLDLAPSALGIAIGSGVVLAFALSPGIQKGSFAGAIAVGFFRAASEAAFFRGYLARRFDRAFGRPWASVAAVTVVFAIYQLSYTDLRAGLGAEGLVRFAIFAVLTSLAYAVIQRKTESVTAPFLCQATASIAVLVASSY